MDGTRCYGYTCCAASDATFYSFFELHPKGLCIPSLESRFGIYTHISFAFVKPRLSRWDLEWEWRHLVTRYGPTARLALCRFGNKFCVGVRGPMIEDLISPFLQRCVYLKKKNASAPLIRFTSHGMYNRMCWDWNGVVQTSTITLEYRSAAKTVALLSMHCELKSFGHKTE